MKEDNDKTNHPDFLTGAEKAPIQLGYPLYPVRDDIYNQAVEEDNIDPENITHSKEPIEDDIVGKPNEKDFKTDESGDDLDIPGGELDDEEENIGEEDEENNYYSLGGDNHNELDEDHRE